MKNRDEDTWDGGAELYRTCAICGMTVTVDEIHGKDGEPQICDRCYSAEVNAGEKWE